MAAEKAQASGAANRDVSSAPPTAAQDCTDVLHISVFFDGTGNNKDVDEATKRWSNVARLYFASQWRAGEEDNNYAVYISGVGTPFNGKADNVLDKAAIDLEDKVTGGLAGEGGTRRLDFGQQQVNDALRNVLLSRAKGLDKSVQKYAKEGQSQSFAEVAKNLAKHRLIKQINVSIFGFSRGAALARSFCNQWLWQCENNRGQLLYEGHPIRFVFLGLFDTVASFGLPATNLANVPLPQFGGFKGRDMVVDDRVERCVHFVAAHELRFSFPVDLIRRGGKTDGRWLEKAYPGVHSDVGGGYEPDEQGVNNNYARITMRDMMREAIAQGCRIVSYDSLSADSATKLLYKERFECLPATETAYKAYVAKCNPSGSIEAQVKAHMAQLYSAYGTLHRQGIESVTQRMHRQGASWRFGPDGMAKEVERYEAAVKLALSPSAVSTGLGAAGMPFRLTVGAYAVWISPQKWQLQAWRKNCDAGVANFVNQFIHDSKVGFIHNAEPFSYFSQRGISESMHSVQGWFDQHVARPVDHAVEATVDYSKEKAAQVKQAASDTADAIERKATETADAVKKRTSELYQEGKRATTEAVDAAERKASEAYQSVKRTTADAIDAAERKASETYQTVKREASDAFDSLSRQASQTTQRAESALKEAGQKASALTDKALESLSEAWKHLPGN